MTTKQQVVSDTPEKLVSEIIENLRASKGGMLGDFLNQQPFCFSGDGLLVFARNLGFLRDAKFISAYDAALSRFEVPELVPLLQSIIWRKHVFTSLALQCLPLEGDFVECGVEWAFGVDLATTYLEFSKYSNKSWFLYDTFSGVPKENFDSGFKVSESITKSYQFELVSRKFSQYDNIYIVQGKLPEVLAQKCPSKISFLHIDLNNAKSELDVLIELVPRVVQGGVILLDDYGALLFSKQHELERKLFQTIGIPIIELPTGQGLIIKNFSSDTLQLDTDSIENFSFPDYISGEKSRLSSLAEESEDRLSEFKAAYRFYLSQIEYINQLIEMDSHPDYHDLCRESIMLHGEATVKFADQMIEYSDKSVFRLKKSHEIRIALQNHIDELQKVIDSKDSFKHSRD